jgi:hypothetical protein
MLPEPEHIRLTPTPVSSYAPKPRFFSSHHPPLNTQMTLIPHPTHTPPHTPILHKAPPRLPIPNLNLTNPPPAHTARSAGTAPRFLDVSNRTGLRASINHIISTNMPLNHPRRMNIAQVEVGNRQRRTYTPHTSHHHYTSPSGATRAANALRRLVGARCSFRPCGVARRRYGRAFRRSALCTYCKFLFSFPG